MRKARAVRGSGRARVHGRCRKLAEVRSACGRRAIAAQRQLRHRRARSTTADRTLHGRERIHWRNISANPTSELQFHLYWNAWRNAESTWLRERRLGGNTTRRDADAWGWTDIRSLPCDARRTASTMLTSLVHYIAPDDGNTRGPTVIAVPLAASRRARTKTIEIEIEWSAKIPRPFARTGYIDDYYFFGQWFPKLGVLEDAGWNTHQFHSRDGVLLRLRRLRRAHDGAARLRRRRVGPTRSARPTAPTAPPCITTTRMTSTTSRGRRVPISSVRTQTFEHPPLPRGGDATAAQPDHAGQEARHFAVARGGAAGTTANGSARTRMTMSPSSTRRSRARAAAWSIRRCSPRARGGLRRTRAINPEEVTIHEAGHQWWYGVVGSNEFEHAWMDEGINQFSEARTDERRSAIATISCAGTSAASSRGSFHDIRVKRANGRGDRLATTGVRRNQTPRRRRRSGTGRRPAATSRTTRPRSGCTRWSDRSAGRHCSVRCPATSNAGSSVIRSPPISSRPSATPPAAT